MNYERSAPLDPVL